MQPLSIDTKGGILVVRFGDGSAFNESQAVELRQGLYSAFGSMTSPQVAMDLTGVDYLSSSGIALLIGAKRRVDAAGGRLVLFNLDPEVSVIFYSMKLNLLFDILPNETEALAGFSAPPTS